MKRRMSEATLANEYAWCFWMLSTFLAYVLEITGFGRGDTAAWLGLVPKKHSTGSKT